jgi:hemerythrin superfamily protein
MNTNIYEALRESHERQRSLCRMLLRAQPGDDRRKDLFKALRIELAAHAAAEERYLYAPMLMDDMGLSPSRHALAEHHRIDECIEVMEKLDTAGDAWLEQARKLSKTVHHHLKEEEKKFFQVSGKILTDTQKQRLAGQYQRDYARMQHKLAQP